MHIFIFFTHSCCPQNYINLKRIFVIRCDHPCQSTPKILETFDRCFCSSKGSSETWWDFKMEDVLFFSLDLKCFTRRSAGSSNIIFLLALLRRLETCSRFFNGFIEMAIWCNPLIFSKCFKIFIFSAHTI